MGLPLGRDPETVGMIGFSRNGLETIIDRQASHVKQSE
jgi:hypothetical protein